MKTEQHIKNELVKLKTKDTPGNQDKLAESIENGDWNEALEACFTLTANIAALITAERVLE